MEKIKQKLKSLTALSFLLFLLCSSCSFMDIDWEKPTDTSKALQGIWQSEGYGFILKIDKGIATLYDYTAISCIKNVNMGNLASSGKEVKDWNVKVNSKKTSFVFKPKEYPTYFTFNKIPQLPALCKNEETTTQNALVNFDILWKTFEEHYAFFELRGIEWQQAKEKYRSVVNENNLFSILTEMLEPFHDDHITLYDGNENYFSGGKDFIFRKLRWADEGYGNFYEFVEGEFGKVLITIIQKYLHGEVQIDGNEKILWGKLDRNIGYVLIKEMSGFSGDGTDDIVALKSVMNNVLFDLKDCKGLVIDMRFNNGGKDQAAEEIAGRFTDTGFPYAWVKAQNVYGFTIPQVLSLRPVDNTFKKPVVGLTSIITASAAEMFVLAMDQIPNVTLVGDSTNGNFSIMFIKNGRILHFQNLDLWEFIIIDMAIGK